MSDTASSPIRGPFFIVGCARSGTTLLQQMLDAHPAIAVAPETCFVRRFHRRRRHFGRLADDHRWRALLTAVASVPEVADMGLDPAELIARGETIERGYGSLLGLLLERFRARSGASVVGEKTPNHALAMPLLGRWFPAARFVHIVRDPRAVALSRRSVPWGTRRLSRSAEVWRRYVRTVRRRGPGAERVHTVGFEDLVARPDVVLGGVCGFLGVAWDPAMLRYAERESSTVDVVREPWKWRALAAVDASRAARWQSVLTPAEVRIVEAVAWSEMRRLGYRPQHRLAALLPAMAAATGLRLARRGVGPVVRQLRRIQPPDPT